MIMTNILKTINLTNFNKKDIGGDDFLNLLRAKQGVK